MTGTRDFELNDELQPGKLVPEGFQDSSGTYPRRDYQGESDTSRAARGGFREEPKAKGIRLAIPTLDSPRNEIISEPDGTLTSKYPQNDVIETPSGHIIEVDDTPGAEKLSATHRSGSKVIMLPSGDVVVKSSDDLYTVVAADNIVLIRGNAKVVIESSASVRIQGDANIEVGGDLNQVIHGDWNVEVAGNANHRIHGNHEESVTGGRLEETRGNVIRRNLGNLKERTVGDHEHEIGGTYRLTAEVKIRMASFGPFNGSFYGGFIINPIFVSGA
jgi:hypothetical protein